MMLGDFYNIFQHYFNVKKCHTYNLKDIFYNFLVLINNHIFICEDNIEKDIIWIVEHRGEKLSLRSYKQIKIFAQNINCDRLLDSLEQLLI